MLLLPEVDAATLLDFCGIIFVIVDGVAVGSEVLRKFFQLLGLFPVFRTWIMTDKYTLWLKMRLCCRIGLDICR